MLMHYILIMGNLQEDVMPCNRLLLGDLLYDWKCEELDGETDTVLTQLDVFSSSYVKDLQCVTGYGCSYWFH